MRSYHGKAELKAEIQKTYDKYIAEFSEIPETLKDKRCEEVDRTPAENLAYQVGWTTLLLQWKADERQGKLVKTPTEDYKWNQLGELYQYFSATYASLSLKDLQERLAKNIQAIYQMLDEMSEAEVFEPHMRKWADNSTKTAVWEVYKFIHVNTVAPFTTFRTKIRKWKRLML
ncbi:ClbS/DfsB family four-helix bundle protein [Ligilactobacillus apodemi]|uniref:ClbS/DfsB family four-helix bundle protein n=1 Tax=Ligilactobacillus apodemi TaxID=307126 RepID=UPI00214B8937|nr:ClbS/DfsB family four-helix bundle protein [Ligilactobacillus apodemi]MCR1901571.1 ClbS/DfsB family four-helix bundle protein [Ligilactobacillus apodemi]